MLDWLKEISKPEYWVAFMEQFGAFRFLAGILLVMIEAFFPPLPLAVLVVVNILGFGFGIGYLLSYIGTCIGTILVYLLIKFVGTKKLIPWLKKHREYQRFQSWIQGKGVFPLILLFSFPFTPSILISGLAALSEIRKREFTMAVLSGKAVMVLILSIIGYNVSDLTNNPMKSVVVITLTFGGLFLAKIIFDKYETFFRSKALQIEDKQRKLGIEIKMKMRYNTRK